MKALTRTVMLTFLFAMLFSSCVDGQQDLKQSIPDFNATECRQFQRRLLTHTLLSTFDRAHSMNLGIAGSSLFWSGLPALPLGISAIILGRRQSTPAVQELFLSGVTSENFEEINRLCSILIKEPSIVDANLDGTNRTAVILGTFATVMASFVLIMQIFFGLLTYWKLKSCTYDADAMSRTEESVIKRNSSLKCGDVNDDERERKKGDLGWHGTGSITHTVQREAGGVRILHDESLDTIDELICISQEQ